MKNRIDIRSWVVAIVGMIYFCLVTTYPVSAQISPGKLTRHHTSLEGMTNCTACHDLGEKVSDQKCLDCHKALKSRVVQNKGYHVSSEVKGKQCISCHSEHHGVNFEMIRFDKTRFNHNLTGYELKGSHKISDCAACHKPANIADISLKLNRNTFLGLSRDCASCHEDFHQGTLSKDCASCHGFDKFSQATGFSHSRTDFPLTGGHTGLQCISCHKEETRNGKPFTRFAGVPFANCNACHQDPHKGEFGKDCKSCHVTESFARMKSSSSFNHSLTGFALEGKHRVLDCKACHDSKWGTADGYKNFDKLRPVSCSTCHEDTHEGKLGIDCKNCHNPSSFTVDGRSLREFDHGRTGFTLVGKHQATDCRSCHKGKFMTERLLHSNCADCHTDYHRGEFAGTSYTDCVFCHNEQGFESGSFDIDRHETASLTLRGAHIATPCNACHWKAERWTFRNIGKQCSDCHENIHKGFISEKYMPENDCAVCHDNDSWRVSDRFDHAATSFRLEGAHQRAECSKCHFDAGPQKNRIQKFLGIDKNCISCHQNVHGNQFELEGITDCARCHGFEKWDRSNFNHDNTRFKLEGAHLTTDCGKCHPTTEIDGVVTIQYKTGRLLCTDCHL